MGEEGTSCFLLDGVAVVGRGSSAVTVGMGDSRLRKPEPKAVLLSATLALPSLASGEHVVTLLTTEHSRDLWDPAQGRLQLMISGYHPFFLLLLQPSQHLR